MLKLYLLELPDSLVSSHVYEIIKTIYTTTAQNTSESARITVIQSTLGQLRLANIATLDAIITHFTRLIELTSAEESYIAQLAATLAPCILRPKQENSLSMAEKFNVRLVRDLFAHKQAIFGELKRQSSLTHTNSGAQRPRAISTDESRRREHFEERQRAIIAAVEGRGRASSPRGASFGDNHTLAAAHGSHRRDRSPGTPTTRFPVAAPGSASTRHGVHRSSLEVPPSPRGPVGTQSPPKVNGTPLATQVEYDDIPRTTRPRSDTNDTTIITPGAAESEMPDYMAHTAGSVDGDSESGANGSSSSNSAANRSSVASSSSASRPFRRAVPTAGLQRQSLISKRDSLSKRDSAGTTASSGAHGEMVASPVDVEDGVEAEIGDDAATGDGHEAGAVRGVELVDRAVDLD